jgi:hypothetical protein
MKISKLPILSLLIVVAWLAGCATMGDVMKSKQKGTAKVYPVTADQAWEISRTVFRLEGSDAIEEHRAQGYMLTSSGVNLVSWGAVMAAWIDPIDKNNTKVTVVTKRRVQINIATTLTETTFHKRFAEEVEMIKTTGTEKAASPSPQRKKEEQKLAYVPKSVIVTKVSLRTKPSKISDSYLRTTLPKYGFYDATLYPQGGSFENQFVDNGDCTISDEATGLMWQKSGSSRMKSKGMDQVYINKLNENQFAGHWNWRLPTIDELSSLLEREKINGVHINPVFDNKQKRCWTSDKADHIDVGHSSEFWWLVDFVNGRGTFAIIGVSMRYKLFENNYVRAVRAIAVRPVE